jgi:arylsulfatase A-like enzyme
MIQWKGHVPAGKVDDRPVISLDIHPTALAAAGVTAQPEKKLDGVNLLPFLDGTSSALPHEVLFWRFGNQMAVRKGDWKITLAAPRPPAGSKAAAEEDEPPARRGLRRQANRNATTQLYNLAQDIGESKDLSAQNPDKFKELQDAWNKWNAELMAPRWCRANRQAGRAMRRAN